MRPSAAASSPGLAAGRSAPCVQHTGGWGAVESVQGMFLAARRSCHLNIKGGDLDASLSSCNGIRNCTSSLLLACGIASYTPSPRSARTRHNTVKWWREARRFVLGTSYVCLTLRVTAARSIAGPNLSVRPASSDWRDTNVFLSRSVLVNEGGFSGEKGGGGSSDENAQCSAEDSQATCCPGCGEG